MAATCTPLDPGEASQVSGPVIPHARASSLILPKSIVGDVSLRLKVLAFRSFQIYQQEEGPQSLSWPVHGVFQPNPPLLDRVRRTPVTRE